MTGLEKMKEKSKAAVVDHQNFTVNLQATKKELVQVEALLEQGMNEYSEEQASMLRLNMAIVEERTCQWSLFQVSNVSSICFYNIITQLHFCFDRGACVTWRMLFVTTLTSRSLTTSSKLTKYRGTTSKSIKKSPASKTEKISACD